MIERRSAGPTIKSGSGGWKHTMSGLRPMRAERAVVVEAELRKVEQRRKVS